MEKFTRQEVKWIHDVIKGEKDKLTNQIRSDNVCNLEFGLATLRKEQLENIEEKLERVLTVKSKRIEIV